ncbi:MAG: porin [Hyphomicrobiales bacterium]|nr:porin [Hyphomicrobiales bacterium]
MKISTLLSGTALSVAAVTASFAADLPVRGPAVAPAPMFVAAPYWAGPYLGVNMGVMHSQTRAAYSNFYDDATGEDLGVGKHNSFGGLVGVTAGYNFQAGNMVYGIEGDIGGVFGSKSDELLYRSSDYNNSTSAQTRALATLRARLGIASGASLFYVTAGAAAVQQKLSIIGNYYAPDGKYGSTSKWKFAPVAGVGIEHQLGGGWTAKVEGLYVFETKQSVNSSFSSEGYGKTFAAKSSHAVVRFGLNYIFGAPAAAGPVLARY